MSGPMWIQDSLVPTLAGSSRRKAGRDRWWVRRPPVTAWAALTGQIGDSTSDDGEEEWSDVDSTVPTPEAVG